MLSPVSEEPAPSGTSQNRADVIVQFLIRLELQKNTGSYSFKFVGVLCNFAFIMAFTHTETAFVKN